MLCTVPSCAWRLALGAGLDIGFTGRLGSLYTGTPVMVLVLVLSVLSPAVACLTSALVSPWGERVPGWVPRLGGRRVPTLAVAGLCAVPTLAPGGPLDNPDVAQGTAGLVMGACYVPLPARGPLVAALTFACVRRHPPREQGRDGRRLNRLSMPGGWFYGVGTREGRWFGRCMTTGRVR
ncbi:hypothetical protein ACL02R_10615 [Streptomyces sp. MS19]|uniref:hypothetical protein n=1 Tax=Streptomyces sp. MS19 TaxID=3385972 RepID=UPI0039A1E144